MSSPEAITAVERYLRQRLLIADFTAQLEPKSDWQRLKERPVVQIGGNLAIAVDIDSIGDGWVRLGDKPRKINYRAGMAVRESALPSPIREALVRTDRHLEGGGSAEDLPLDVAVLLRPYRRVVLIEPDEAENLREKVA
jgi:hypothetical protein